MTRFAINAIFGCSDYIEPRRSQEHKRPAMCFILIATYFHTHRRPSEFDDGEITRDSAAADMDIGAGDNKEGEESDSDSEMEEVFVNRNRQQRYMETDSEDSGSESDDEASASANDESSAVSS